MTSIGFLSNTTTRPINRYLKEYKLTHFPINSIVQTLNTFISADYLVILLEANYFLEGQILNEYSFTRLAELEQLLIHFRKTNDTKVLLSNIHHCPLVISSMFDAKQQLELAEFNEKIAQLTQISDVTILDINGQISRFGRETFFNDKNGFLFQTPWTKFAFSSLSKLIKNAITLFIKLRKKLLILDADNTLWGGIIGEDGLDGIAIDNNYPGIIYQHFQQQLKVLKDSGLLLVLISKNNFKDVKDVFDVKNMPLSFDDFVSKKINWQAKSRNIKTIIDELNIGLDSAIFFDDSDFELAEVKQNLGIDVVKISSDNPIENLQLLDSITQLKSLSLSIEDQTKTAQYQAQTQRKNIQNKFNSMEDYLTSIKMKLSFAINKTTQLKRITQLINKTNQFNLTTKRYSETEVLEFMEKHQLFSFSLSDKFGDLGLVAVLIIKDRMIDTFLISCRALSRNIERKILHLIAQNFDLPLKAQYIKSSKNEQVSTFYEELGLKVVDKNTQQTLYNWQKNIEDVFYIEVIND